MATDEVVIDVNGAADEVWAIIGDFDGADNLFPAIEKITLEDSDAGHDRIISMFGMDIRERLISKDDEARVLVYSVIDLPKHLASITVTPTDSGSSVSWKFDVEPDNMAEMLHGTYQGGLEELARRFA